MIKPLTKQELADRFNNTYPIGYPVLYWDYLGSQKKVSWIASRAEVLGPTVIVWLKHENGPWPLDNVEPMGM